MTAQALRVPLWMVDQARADFGDQFVSDRLPILKAAGVVEIVEQKGVSGNENSSIKNRN